jgi:hypothetical protein
MDVDVFKRQLKELKNACEKDDVTIKKAVSRVVDTYRPDGENTGADEEEKEKTA